MARTKKKENPVKKNSGRAGWPRPFASLDENRRKMILKFCGLMTCAFAVFTLIKDSFYANIAEMNLIKKSGYLMFSNCCFISFSLSCISLSSPAEFPIERTTSVLL